MRFGLVIECGLLSSGVVFRFLFLCANSKWAPLYTAAMDTLSNLACDVCLFTAWLILF